MEQILTRAISALRAADRKKASTMCIDYADVMLLTAAKLTGPFIAAYGPLNQEMLPGQ